MVFQEFVKDQVFSPVAIAAALRTTKSEIASTLGLGRDAFSRASRIRARKTQLRTRQMLEILNRVEAESGSLLAAYAWFRSEPLPASAAPRRTCCCARARPARTCLPRPNYGGGLCLIPCSSDAVPGASHSGRGTAPTMPPGPTNPPRQMALQGVIGS